MSSVLEAGDLTSRARIIAAGLDRFAAVGYRAATLRSIADEAGVSAALIVHHFGDKDGLRTACDERVVRFVVDKREPDAAGEALTDALRRYGPYLARMLGEEGPASDALFTALLNVARNAVAEGTAAGTMRSSDDPEAQAAALLALSVAPFFVAHQLARWSEGDAQAGILRIAGPISDIYRHGLFLEPRADGDRG